MKIKKIETNIKRNFLFNETEKILYSNNKNLENNIIKIDDNYTFQNILGFGGAFTESTGYSLTTVPNNIHNKIMNDYFSKEGLNYNFCRLPIGSTDFSLDSYSYSYKDDLSDFSIQRDKKYIIPAIKAAQKINQNIKFLSTPWSPPAFMKNNNNVCNGGKLLDKYKDTWANYLVKYVKAYKNESIKIDYMTIQNEPNATQSWESCNYTAYDEANLLKKHLFPIFRKNGLDTKFLIWDHNKDSILERVKETLIDNATIDLACGIAFHWYTGSHFDSLDLINKLFPNKLLIHTEGCTGYSKFKLKDELFNAEMYASEIIGDFNNGTNAFIDWNMVLEYNGGPNHKKNYCNSPIMINKNHSDYIKTPSYYYIGHFSKYIMPGAKRIHSSKFSEKISAIAFKNPDNSVIINLLNTNNYNIEYNLCYNNCVFHDNLDSHAIVTFIINGV